MSLSESEPLLATPPPLPTRDPSIQTGKIIQARDVTMIRTTHEFSMAAKYPQRIVPLLRTKFKDIADLGPLQITLANRWALTLSDKQPIISEL